MRILETNENMAENKSRQQSYKANVKSVQELRTRRHDVTVELRKSKKDDQMLKRRNIESNEIDPTSPLKEQNQQDPLSQPTMTLDEILIGMASNNLTVVFQATQAARKMLSRERNPPIDVMVSLGIVPLCTKFLDCFDKYAVEVLLKLVSVSLICDFVLFAQFRFAV